MSILIVDYGVCNLDSVKRAIEECGGSAFVSADPADLRDATKAILPGVGSFSESMKTIRSRGWNEALRTEAGVNGLPLLGICLGMQLLAERGYEGDMAEGIGLIPGEVRRLEARDQSERIPHVGWNEVAFSREHPLLRDIPSQKDFYFAHSYSFRPAAESDVIARTPYCGVFVSAIGRKNVVGVQFHPEKSQRPGLQLLKNFVEW